MRSQMDNGWFLQYLVIYGREHSPLGVVWLYAWSPVLQVWTQLHQYTHFLIKSNPVNLETSKVSKV